MDNSPSFVKESSQALIIEDEEGYTKVNQYKITELIGHGSYATVSSGYDINTKEKYAFKQLVVKKQRHMSQTMQPNVKTEIAILKRIKHPNIVTLHEVLNYEDVYFLVFELCENGPLMKVKLNEQFACFDLEKAKHYFKQLFLGVEYLHYNEIIHCDIKPDNLLLDKNKDLKITDFGVSQIFDVENKTNNELGLIGSPAFLAPEALKENMISKSIDIWAMGVVLFCMVEGRMPFTGKNIIELENSILNTEIKTHKNSVLHKHELLKDFLDKMFIKDFNNRITIDGIRNHSWLNAQNDNPPLLVSREDNIRKITHDITATEINHAINEARSLWKIVHAINKFKGLKRKIHDKKNNK